MNGAAGEGMGLGGVVVGVSGGLGRLDGEEPVALAQPRLVQARLQASQTSSQRPFFALGGKSADLVTGEVGLGLGGAGGGGGEADVGDLCRQLAHAMPVHLGQPAGALRQNIGPRPPVLCPRSNIKKWPEARSKEQTARAEGREAFLPANLPRLQHHSCLLEPLLVSQKEAKE